MSSNLRLLRACFNRFTNQRYFFLQSSSHAPITIPMPALSPTMEEGSIVRWLVKVGDEVQVGDALCEVETDKAVVTVESSDDGIIAKILKEEGTKNIKLSVPIAIMAEEGENLEEAQNFVPQDSTSSNTQDSTSIANDSTSTQNSPALDEITVTYTTKPLSPAVRQAIEWYNIDASVVPSSGKNGRLLKGDVLRFITANNLIKQDQKAKNPVVSAPKPSRVAPPIPPKPTSKEVSTPATAKSTSVQPTGRTKVKYEDIELTNVRKIIASRLTESKQQIPHSYNSISCNVDSIIELRSSLKENGIKLSMNDFVVKAAGMALQRNKLVNSTWKNGVVEESTNSDISIAVATPGGLITPIIKSVESKGLEEISKETRSLAGRARDGKLKPEEFQGGTFTISNLGMFGVTEFTAVINPPQTCIMAVGGTQQKIHLDSSCDEDSDEFNADQFVKENLITVTLSSDARVVNDQEASVFLDSFKSNLENPINMFLG